ncbi:hypothetical protein V1281_002981 [Nitrobacteraceae bacterium AZCC 2161]
MFQFSNRAIAQSKTGRVGLKTGRYQILADQDDAGGDDDDDGYQTWKETAN